MFSDSNEFGEDDSDNYHFQFLKTTKTPKTSTQKQIHEKQHLYHQYSYESELQTSTEKFGNKNVNVPAATNTITATSNGACNFIARKRAYDEASVSQLKTSSAKLPKIVYKRVPNTKDIRAGSITPINNGSEVTCKRIIFPAATNTIRASSVGECNSVARKITCSGEAFTSQFQTSSGKMPTFIYKTVKATSNIRPASVNHSNDASDSQPEIIESDSTNKQRDESAISTCNMVCTKCVDNEKLILANTALLNVLLKEVKCLRREQQHNLTNQSGNRDGNLPQLHLPAETLDDSKGIEHQIKAEDCEMALTKVFKQINEPTNDKFIRACLKSVITELLIPQQQIFRGLVRAIIFR